jgi:hypothetical protein
MPILEKKYDVVEAQRRERGQAYAVMVNSWAWKDLQRRIQLMVDKSTFMLDDTDPGDVTMIHVGIVKGFRKAFKTLEKEVQFVLGDK